VAKLKQTKRVGQQGQLRIIAGKWRGRKLQFPEVAHLRPTPDRVRETVFNWLQPYIGGARCLDLFAGSGALSFESLSRGADYVTMIELDNSAAQQLQLHVKTLSADNAEVQKKSAQQYLIQTKQQYDIVFIDPPYQAALWTEIAELLVEQDVLADNAMIYLECPSKQAFPKLPSHWHILKDKTAGDVRYCLLTVDAGEDE